MDKITYREKDAFHVLSKKISQHFADSLNISARAVGKSFCRCGISLAFFFEFRQRTARIANNTIGIAATRAVVGNHFAKTIVDVSAIEQRENVSKYVFSISVDATIFAASF
jgi:hypothetical protein